MTAHEQTHLCLCAVLLCSGRCSVTHSKWMPAWWWLFCSTWRSVHLHPRVWRQQRWETWWVWWALADEWYSLVTKCDSRENWGGYFYQKIFGNYFFWEGLSTSYFKEKFVPALVWFFMFCFFFNICEVQDSHESSYGYYTAKQVFPHSHSRKIQQVIHFSLICGTRIKFVQ